MRIGFFVPRCTTDNSHGRSVIALAERFATSHDVTVYTGAGGLPTGTPASLRWLPVLDRPAVARLAMLWTASALVSTRERFDVTHVQGADALVGNVVTAQCCNAAMRGASGRRSAIRRLNMALGTMAERVRFGRRGTKAVIAVSEKVQREVVSHYGVDAARTTVIPLGVDVDAFHPGSRARGEARRDLGISRGEFVIAYVGGDYVLKGLLPLARAVRALPFPLRLFAVGVRPDRFLENVVGRDGLREKIVLVGRTPDVARYYRAADVFVLPTLYDTFSMATAEAMASGVPVIVSREAGIAEWLTDGVDAVLLRDPRDATELARAVARLQADERLRSRLAENGRRTAEGFAWEHVAERTLSVYRRVVAGAPAPV
jgi:UDP-glucose:(heptosyl)LPS alpha-1,3-glucosyltransferase